MYPTRPTFDPIELRAPSIHIALLPGLICTLAAFQHVAERHLLPPRLLLHLSIDLVLDLPEITGQLLPSTFYPLDPERCIHPIFINTTPPPFLFRP